MKMYLAGYTNDFMRYYFILLLFMAPLWAQAQVDHWESVIREGRSWQYLVPSAELPSHWTTDSFNDDGWNSGLSGFGYGDSDDNTVIETSLSVFLRKEFQISNLAEIASLVLHMDYDDGFIAYLNGVEVARAQMSNGAFNAPSNGLHEALLYQGLVPESFVIDPALLRSGSNILAVQVHNQSLTSSDLTAIPVLSVGLNTAVTRYEPIPSWFVPPLNFTSSELPIMVINTNSAIPDEPKVLGTFGIIYNGEGATNHVNDPWNEYNGYCGIEIRGSSSQSFPKKSYSIEIRDAAGEDLDTSFLNFPTEEDWALHGPYSDKSLLNNALAMKLANDMGHYSSRTRLVELMLNGQYKGIYLVMERIKRDKNRVDIAKLNPDEVSGDDLTGGYIFKIDRSDGPNDRWFSQHNMYGSSDKLMFVLHTPDPEEIVPAQRAYLQNYVGEFEAAMASPSFVNSRGRHYSNYIDIASFADNFILNELSKDVDAYRLSTFFHKDKDSNGGRIKAGPYWDFNLAFGNGDYCGGEDPTGWEYYQCVGNSPFWWDVWLQDEIFTNALQCRWTELRSSVLTIENIAGYLDSTALAMPGAVERNFQQWPVMGTYVWPNSPFYASARSHGEVLTEMKNWIATRIHWLDDNMPGEAVNCEFYLNYEQEIVTSLDQPDENRLMVFPNPSGSTITIRSHSPILRLQVFSLDGKMIYELLPNDLQTTLNESLPKGIYLLKVETREGIENRRIIRK